MAFYYSDMLREFEGASACAFPPRPSSVNALELLVFGRQPALCGGSGNSKESRLGLRPWRAGGRAARVNDRQKVEGDLLQRSMGQEYCRGRVRVSYALYLWAAPSVGSFRVRRYLVSRSGPV